jgi:Xaa-Pro aminopeptidase
MSALLIPAEGEPTFLMNEMHRDILSYSGSWITDVITHEDGEPPLQTLAELLQRRGLSDGRIGVEPSLWYGDVELLRRAAPRAEVVDASRICSDLRSVKDETEIELIRRACRASVSGFRQALESAVPGRAATEVAVEIATAIVANGGEDVGLLWPMFSRHFGNRRLQKHDVIPLDIGTQVSGYHSDTARTVFVGGISPELRETYEILLSAREKIVSEIRPGVTCEYLHRLGCEEVARTGSKLVWRIGHGVGLSANHEPPFLQWGNTDVIEARMVFVIDPGIHVDGYETDLPVAIEDVFLVTSDGAECLTDFDLGPLVTS